MPNIKTEISPFLIHDPQQNNEAISLLVSHPSTQELDSLGRLFMLIKAAPANEQTKQVIETVQRQGKEFYYQQLESNMELAFEGMLKKLNELLSSHLEHVSAEWLNDFHAIIGVIKGTDLYFTQVGSLHAFYIHKQSVVNIFEQTKGAESRINPLKIFSQTISGQISADDTLMLCTPSILDYLSLERLRTIIQSGSGNQISMTLENLLAPNNGNASFAALIIKQASETTPVNVAPRTSPQYGSSASQASMDQLTNREASTNQLLTPSTWSYLGQVTKSISQRVSGLLEKVGIKAKQPPRRSQNQVQYYTPVHETYKPRRTSNYPSRFVYVLGKILTGFQYIIVGIKGLLVGLFNLISGRKNIKQKLQHLPTTATGSVSKPILLFQRLTKQRKILLLVVVLLIFIFAQSVIYMSRRGETEKQLEIYSESLAQATSKQEEAEASLLYGDEDGARLLLRQAQDLIASIPEKEQEKRYQSDIAALETKIEALYSKTKHINTISDPAVIADLGTLEEGLTLNGIAGIYNEEIIGFSNNQTEIFETNINTKESIAIDYTDPAEGSPALGAPLSTRVSAIYVPDNTILEYDSVNNSFSNATVDFENQDRTLTSLVTYNGRLYFLDTKNNQIFRHQKAGGNYQTGDSWLTDENADVSNGVALAVDGSIYVLRSNGELTKYFQGGLDNEFSLSEIDPVLSSPTKLFTDEAANYIYILEPSQKRLLVFTSNGRLKNQYTSESFDNLIDMAIDEANKKAYLLNGTVIYTVDLLE